ncbi:NUDIX domain-containing protein [Bacillus sp. CGMCC 1.16607]|uniref:NUDIX domain-containing protein n=1 Tax=Bacillus sp. CGMCC 1.16607 TaxID=3351842 RepID=UPI0036360035
MQKSIYVDWNGHNVKLTWYPGFLPNYDKVTSVHGVCFEQEKVLLVQIEGRGFNFPGGHVEKEELPENAIHREVYEEGYVKGTIKLLGAIEVSHKNNPLFDPNGKYPLIGYQLFYRMDISECYPFLRENEAKTRIWAEPAEVPFIINDHELIHFILEKALIL